MKPEEGLHFSFPNFVVHRVQASGVDLNENFVRLRHWPGNVSEPDLIWSAIAFEDKCFHFLVCVGCALCAPSRTHALLALRVTQFNWAKLFTFNSCKDFLRTRSNLFNRKLSSRSI